ncbi:hypothetical protein ACOSE7_004339 [Escherichia coli]|uniref:hypothetical protein n=1 Tax=Escherichia TaxID=561 RepID=UPI0005A8422A|nr:MULTISPECIES: hypothetical protein [Escherichia]EFA9900626.1 hypothetical protein [Escherichia coli]EFY9122405.1 hypothetical protein [Shigella flexneri]MCZ7517439.1 hypothetical protein [Escherichia albertii]
MNDKFCFLLKSSLLYKEFTTLTENDCLRRFLAFKIVLNCMSFEDLVGNRQFNSIRSIRDVFLAHKQEGDFFNAFNATNLINSSLIDKMISFMETHTTLDKSTFPELNDNRLRDKIFKVTKAILEKIEEDYFSGYRFSNNFLCTQKKQITEISSGPIASIFYRYNSSKQLGFFSNYFISNLINSHDMSLILHNAKIDYVLHAVNMFDCIFKDTKNIYSIDGLQEVLQAENIGDISALVSLQQDSSLLATYKKLRNIRNKLAGHMDNRNSLEDLLTSLDKLDFEDVFCFVNRLDKAVHDTAKTHVAIGVHYMHNQPRASNIDDLNVIEVNGLENEPYFNS